MNEPGLRSAAVACRAAVHSWQDLPLGGEQVAESLSARTSVLPELPQFQRLLASSLDTLGVGLEIWDEQDRLLLYNKKLNLMFSDLHTPDHLGQTYEALMRVNLKRQLIPAAVGCEEEWLAQRLATRATHSDAQLQEFGSNCWVNLYETRTPEGGVVTAWVDVTPLVQREKNLEANNHQLARQSMTDDLTGLANRRQFDGALLTEWLRAARSGTSLSLLMVDIDHFKKYNDHYGHLAGDECLRRVATALGQCVRRAGELVARYGGEEFVMLLPGADMAHACETAQKCLDQLRSSALPHAASPTANQVTLSVGVASLLPDATLNAARLVNAADAAMYRAKSGGRARYEIASQADWEIDGNTPRTHV